MGTLSYSVTLNKRNIGKHFKIKHIHHKRFLKFRKIEKIHYFIRTGLYIKNSIWSRNFIKDVHISVDETCKII